MGFFGYGRVANGTVLGSVLGGHGFFGPNFVSSKSLIGWTSRVSPDINDLQSIAFSGTSFVAADDNIPGNVVRSVNSGAAWTLIANAGAPAVGAGVIGYGNGIYLLGCGQGNTRLSSDDGVTWGATGSNPFGVGIGCGAVCYGLGVWLVLGNAAGPNNYATSANNGVTWTLPALFTNASWDGNGLIFDGVQFVAIGAASGGLGPAIYTSNDAIHWVQTLLPGNPLRNRPVAFGNGVYMLGEATANTVRIAATPAGLAAAANTPVTFDPGTGDTSIYSVGFGTPGGVPTFVVVGDLGGVCTSTNNGVTWIPGLLNFPPVNSGNSARAIGFGANTFVAVGDAGDISTLP